MLTSLHLELKYGSIALNGMKDCNEKRQNILMFSDHYCSLFVIKEAASLSCHCCLRPHTCDVILAPAVATYHHESLLVL